MLDTDGILYTGQTHGTIKIVHKFEFIVCMLVCVYVYMCVYRLCVLAGVAAYT